MKYTPTDVFKYINIIESKFSLLESDLMGVFYWQQVRHEIFRDLCYKLKVYNTKSSSDNFSQKKSGNGTGILAFFDSIIKFLWKVKQSDTVIINSGRFRKVNGQLLDVYTYPMIQSLRDKGLCFAEVSLNSFKFVSTENAIDTRWAKYIA
ncbi:hypothetical protein, partial [Salinivibrio sp. AR640]|uniref:hypothetical protein n=1 Tax=Salinivibrio sp. AR640 TaxID=1909437 RepID=UPI0009D5DCB9